MTTPRRSFLSLGLAVSLWVTVAAGLSASEALVNPLDDPPSPPNYQPLPGRAVGVVALAPETFWRGRAATGLRTRPASPGARPATAGFTSRPEAVRTGSHSRSPSGRWAAKFKTMTTWSWPPRTPSSPGASPVPLLRSKSRSTRGRGVRRRNSSRPPPSGHWTARSIIGFVSLRRSPRSATATRPPCASQGA